ncbi:putative mannitol dehydrogenase [Capsicum annuum]|nr:putative mannitol dehydrogenase [Capsicum annuum]
MAKSYENEHPIKAFGWSARDTSGILSPFNFSRRATGENDVQFKVLYCGICHSDLHKIKNEWGNSKYPIVPGHEIVGVVTEVGSKVNKVNIGDNVGVGVLIGSCRTCNSCTNDLEQYCPSAISTYNTMYYDGTTTYGGYSDLMVANEHFVFRWPENLPMEAAPLLCAGITTYSPLKYFGLDKPGLHIGVVGLGGLGHMAVKFAKAFGANVTIISTSINKKDEAIKLLGANSFLLSHDPEQMQEVFNDECTIDEPIDSHNTKNYRVLRAMDICKLMQEDISKTSTILSVSTDVLVALLRHYNWNVARADEEWFANEPKVQKSIDMSSQKETKNSAPLTLTLTLTCGICFEEYPLDKIDFADCKHPFCKQCWECYISTSIDSGSRCLVLRCPEPCCKIMVGQSKTIMLASERDRLKYHDYLYRSYIDENKKIKRCPGPGCVNAVEFEIGS